MRRIVNLGREKEKQEFKFGLRQPDRGLKSLSAMLRNEGTVPIGIPYTLSKREFCKGITVRSQSQGKYWNWPSQAADFVQFRSCLRQIYFGKEFEERK